MTRQIQKPQMELGQINIADIKFDPKSRDDIPKILKGLQYIYVTDSICKPIFKLLEEKVLPGIDKKNGRPGMELWKILVMGILRLDLNCDYDRLHELANNHKTVRQMLGNSGFMDEQHYNLQTIKDNTSLLTPELLSEINEIIVKAGHQLLGKKKENEPLRGRCDSFVVETHVHYPTDISLLYDAVRKVIQLTAQLSEAHEFNDWRQYAFNVKQVKKQMRIAQKKKRASGKTEGQKAKCKEAVKESHQTVLKLAQQFLTKSEETFAKIQNSGFISISDLILIDNANNYAKHASRQIDQIRRRVIQEEILPHGEKVFSIFQPHTEWISKGKAGVQVELGLRVCVMEDQHQFILHHRVMEKETDDQVAVPMIVKTKSMYANMNSCSFDKGFHSPENQKKLSEHLEVVALRCKGKLSEKRKEVESSEAFKKAHDKHSTVESAINALENHGLDKCRDHGIDGFKRYVALSIVARNIHRIGDLLYKKEQKCLVRKNRHCRDEILKIVG